MILGGPTTPGNIGAVPVVQPLFGFTMLSGLVLSAVAVYKDSGHVSRNTDWSPVRWLWTIGSPFGPMGVVVTTAYVYRRSEKTRQSSSL